MRVLLTGAAGFFGSRAARHFDDCEVVALDHPGADWSRLAALAPRASRVELDLTDAQRVAACVADVKPDVAVHLAWYAVPGKYLSAPDNLDHLTASLALARRLADAGCPRLVTAGTCFEYDTSIAEPRSESSPCAPRFVYSACKHAMFEVLREAARVWGTSYAHLRFFYQYGPWEAPGRIVPAVVGALLRGEEAKVTAGEQVRDFLHVDDVAAAIRAVATSDLEGAVNVGSGRPSKLREIIAAAADACGRPELVRYGAIPHRDGDPMYVCANADRLRTTGWVPRVDLEEGMRDTVQWWRDRAMISGETR